jgi:hypothetical protein
MRHGKVGTNAAGVQASALRRDLSLKDLVFYGLVLIQPIVPPHDISSSD